MKRKLNTNSRVLSDVFADYPNTFIAFCELINNAIQAKSKNINIRIDQVAPEEVAPVLINKIVIEDDGYGVPESEFDNKILQIGTDAKAGGRGIGRFAALQIGSSITIETTGYDRQKNKFTKVILPISFVDKINKDLSEFEFETEDETFDDKKATYYKVTIMDVYDSSTCEKDRRKRIDPNLLVENISSAIFRRYPYEIFNEEVAFYINEVKIDRNNYIEGNPAFIDSEFVDKKGEKHAVSFQFYKIKSDKSDIKVLLTVENAGLKTVCGSFDYSADWLSPQIGCWFIYIHSDMITTDFNRNMDLEDLNEDYKLFRIYLKEILFEFFKELNKDYEEFTVKLKEDKYYPYKKVPASSTSQENTFEKVAYLVETKYHLLNTAEPTRELIYPLIDKSIANGNLRMIFNSILKLEEEYLIKLNDLLEKSDLESVIEFSENVASKTRFLDFLNTIIYGEPAKRVKERSQLHKFVEKNLWIFGEQYTFTPNLTVLSDKNLSHNLDRLRAQYLTYEPTEQDENLIGNVDEKLKNITDLFFYNEKITDDGSREIMIIELKAPHVKIGAKELNQIDRYQYQIEREAVFSENLKYRLFLISSDLTDFAKSKIGQFDSRQPFLYSKSKGKDIESFVIRWGNLLEHNQRRLSYLGNALKTKDEGVIEEFEKEFNEIKFENIKSKKSHLHYKKRTMSI
jgi:hypothetical protein